MTKRIVTLFQNLPFSVISGMFLLQTQDPSTPSCALSIQRPRAPQKRRHVDLLVSFVACALGVIFKKPLLIQSHGD